MSIRGLGGDVGGEAGTSLGVDIEDRRSAGIP